MANNFFDQARQQENTPFEIERGIASRRKAFEANKPPLNLKTPGNFRKGFFGRPDLNDIQAGFAFREAIESGNQAVVQQFIDAGMYDNLDETATQKAVEMIQNVKDIQKRLTPRGIAVYGGIRRLLKDGFPGQEKPQTIQTPKGPQQKFIKGPTTDDLAIRERLAAGDSILEATRSLARAKKGEPIEKEEKRPLFETEPTRKQITAIEKAKKQPTQFEKRKQLLAESKFNESLKKISSKKKVSFTDIGKIVDDVIEFSSDMDGNIDNEKAWNLFQGIRESLPDDFAKTNLFNLFQTQFGNPPLNIGRLQQDVNAGAIESLKTGPLPPGVTETDIKFTAEKHGLTLEEVMKRLGNAP